MSKKKEKSIEELLEEALVPKEEQPYEVPANWVWVRIIQILEKLESRDPSTFSSEVFHYIDVESIDNKKQRVKEYKILPISDAPSRARRAIRRKDVIISLVRPYLKNIALIEEDDELAVASTAFYVCRSKESLIPEFLYNYLRGLTATSYLNAHTKGDNSPSVRNSDFENMPFPLPPLNEQKRIADKVERLLDKINQAKQLIEEAKETFDLRRAAILDKAFRGELTAKWREQHGFHETVGATLPKGWRIAQIGDEFTLKSGNSIKEDKVVPNGTIPYIKVADMNSEENSKEIVNATRFVSDDFVKEGHIFPTGTVIFPKRGGAIHTNKKRILKIDTLCDLNIMGIICPDYVNPYYLYYWFLNVDLRKLDNGSTIPQINNKDIQPLLIPLPSMIEQNEIVRMLDRMLEKLDNEYKILTVINITQLESSIVSKAFRGELGTNDPNEESAMRLLEEILSNSK